MLAKSYANYAFYKSEYYGDAMAESEFDKWSAKASRQIDVFTSRRLLSAYPSDEYSDAQIKLCVCELAEKMVDVDTYMRMSAVQENGVSKIIKSMSAGSESVTYATSESIYAELVKDKAKLNNFYYAICVDYLDGIEDSEGICLLYRGL